MNHRERTEALTEAINAVIELQDSYTRDWTHAVHGEAWEAEWGKGL